MTLYDHLYGPPVWTRWLNGAGLALSLWLVLWPQPYQPLLAAVAALPLVCLLAGLRWPGDFGLGATGEGSVTGLLLAPVVAVTIRAFVDVKLLDWLSPLLAGAGVGVAVAIAGWWFLKALGWELIGCFLFGLMWGWSGAVLLNVELDRTPGALQVAEVVGSGNLRRSGPYLELRLPDGQSTHRIGVGYSQYENTQTGDRVCLAVNPGSFGWRSVRVVDCTGPLRSLDAGLEPAENPPPLSE